MKRDETVIVIITTLIILIGGGTVFFHLVEKWTWLDSYFFTVITLSTVGYGNLVPATAIGKIGTTVLIFAGLGVFAAVIQHVGRVAVFRRLKTRRRKLNERRQAAKEREME